MSQCALCYGGGTVHRPPNYVAEYACPACGGSGETPDTALATRLAEVERERDALREGLADIARHLAPPFEGEGSHLAWKRATALLGKENEDGQ